MNILLPIQRPYTDQIFQGFKFFEFRTRVPQNLVPGDTIYIYESKAKGGAGKVIGQAKLKDILPIPKHEPLSFLKDIYAESYIQPKTRSLVSCEEWGRQIGYINKWGVCIWNFAIQLTEVQRYMIPKDLHEFEGVKGPLIKAPQSFCYIPNIK